MENHCIYPKELSCTSPDYPTSIEWSDIKNASIEWIMQVAYLIRSNKILSESDQLSTSIKCIFLRHSLYKLDIDMSELDV